MILAVLAASVAHAQSSADLEGGFPIDIELLKPTFSDGSFLGVDTTRVVDDKSVRVGLFTQYERDPLVLYESARERGEVVANRQALHLGVSHDFDEALGFRLAVPLAGQWGSGTPRWQGDGVAFGDVYGGLRWVPDRDGVLRVGVRGDLYLPTGGQQAYMGEALPRVHAGALASLHVGASEVLGEAGVMTRDPVQTNLDFRLANELVASVAYRLALWPDRAWIGGSVLTRTGLRNPYLRGAETSSELLAGVQLRPRESLQMDMAVGKGLADGYGTSEFRAVFGLTFILRPEPPPLPAISIVERPPEVPPVEEPPPEWKPEELARIDASQIVIREPIEFEVDTANILPQSLPVLRQVAVILNEHGEIGHLVIEGHASEEGTYEYNYALSNERARSIFTELVRSGVHPERLSTRGMGEVEPVKTGADETDLAPNRRVEFHITHYLTPDDPPAAYPPQIRLPWSGEEATATVPVLEKPKPPSTDPDSLFEAGEGDEDLELERTPDRPGTDAPDAPPGETP